MNLAMSGESLLDLAKSRQPADRERLLLAIADLCDAPHAGEAMRSAGTQALLSSILMILVVKAEKDIRQRLSQKLASADWAPCALINMLALDAIEIARPIIALSPLLRDSDLVRLLVEATIEHQIEVARRPRLTRAVVAAILEQAEPAVLTALAGNHTAELSAADMDELVEISRQVAAMRTPLSQHPKLTDQLARRLYIWVGVALRQGLSERFRIDPAAFDKALAGAISDAHGDISPDAAPRTSREGEQVVMAQRLIDKLHAADQLRPAYLVRALREGQLGLFAAALAVLGRFDAAQVRATLDSDRPELLALACAAVGIDRSVFPDILDMARKLNNGRPGCGGGAGPRKASVVFAPVSAEVAGLAFRQAVRSLTSP